MKVVDSIPVTFDRLNDYTGSLDMAPVAGRRPRRFRTVSESAVVRQQLLDECKAADNASNSLRNIAEHRELPEAGTQPAVSSDSDSNGPSTSSNSNRDIAPLTSNVELNEE